MSIDLEVQGKFARLDDRMPAERLAEIGELISTAIGEGLLAMDINYDGDEPHLYAQLHPSAEYVSISSDPRGMLSLHARTSTVGPGYHEFICDLIDDIAEDCEVEWSTDSLIGGDPTGYLSGRDRVDLQNAFLAWLQQVGQQMVKLAADGFVGFAISMPTGVLYEHDGLLITPLGPRSVDWAIAVAENPFNGIDIFPWWERRRNAYYHLQRAIAEMWTETRWRPPLTEHEQRSLERVLNHLQQAWELDEGASADNLPSALPPSKAGEADTAGNDGDAAAGDGDSVADESAGAIAAPDADVGADEADDEEVPSPPLVFPYREWAELLTYAEAVQADLSAVPRDVVERRALDVPQSAQQIGYRRQDVRVLALPGDWSLSIPGSFAEDWENESTWRAFDLDHTVRVTSFMVEFRVGGKPGPDDLLDHATELPEGLTEELPEFTRGPLKSRGNYGTTTENGQAVHMLHVRAAIEGRLAVVTILFRDEAEREWAERVWHSLNPPPESDEEGEDFEGDDDDEAEFGGPVDES